MLVFDSLDKIRNAGPSVVTVGTFDGVHLGHQKIVDFLKAKAKYFQALATVVTFNPHPKKILAKNSNTPIRVLTSLPEKLAYFSMQGITQAVVIQFTREFAGISYQDFVQKILLTKLNARAIIVGYDHHFGKNREGSYENLKLLGEKLGFETFQVPPHKVQGKIVSSSEIRKLLCEGKIEEVTRFLGRPYSLFGLVEHGDGRGQGLGFPTANIRVTDPEKIIPPRGVYAVDVWVDKKEYAGMMNIGIRPTFNIDTLTLEVHIFNFNASIYNKNIEVRFKKRIRDEQKFEDAEALKKQLEYDKKICEAL